MNTLACGVSAVFFSITLVFTFILFSSGTSLEHEKMILNASNISKLPNISLSTPYIDSRIIEYQDFSNDFYFGMKKDTYSGFVYAK